MLAPALAEDTSPLGMPDRKARLFDGIKEHWRRVPDRHADHAGVVPGSFAEAIAKVAAHGGWPTVTARPTFSKRATALERHGRNYRAVTRLRAVHGNPRTGAVPVPFPVSIN